MKANYLTCTMALCSISVRQHTDQVLNHPQCGCITLLLSLFFMMCIISEFDTLVSSPSPPTLIPCIVLECLDYISNGRIFIWRGIEFGEFQNTHQTGKLKSSHAYLQRFESVMDRVRFVVFMMAMSDETSQYTSPSNLPYQVRN